MAGTQSHSPAEQLFESYLQTQELDWEYEPEFDGKHPDYLVSYSGGQCVLEVESLIDPNPRPKSGFLPNTADTGSGARSPPSIGCIRISSRRSRALERVRPASRQGG